jgi:thioredoxin reductase
MLEKLIDSNIEVILEDHVDVDFDYQLHDHEAELEEGEKVIPSALFFKRRTVCTRKGRKIHTDLVIPCLQGTPNTEALRRYFSAHLTESGHVDVRNTMQLPSTDNIFVCGDIVNREHCDLYINVKVCGL